jgi:deoxyadenosine/deoxycytidine kinase
MSAASSAMQGESRRVSATHPDSAVTAGVTAAERTLTFFKDHRMYATLVKDGALIHVHEPPAIPDEADVFARHSAILASHHAMFQWLIAEYHPLDVWVSGDSPSELMEDAHREMTCAEFAKYVQLFTTLTAHSCITVVCEESRKPRKPRVLVLEGPIGVGKSTLGEYLKRTIPGVLFVPENLALWSDLVIENRPGYTGESKKINLLDEMYNGRMSNFHAQMWFLALVEDRYAILDTDAPETPVDTPAITAETTLVIFERSVRSCEVFAKVNASTYSPDEYELYQRHSRHASRRFAKLDAKTLYLKCDPEVAADRTERRGRSEESAVDREYLRQISRGMDAHFEASADFVIDVSENSPEEPHKYYKSATDAALAMLQ